MTDLGEAVAIIIEKDKKLDSKCPFCYKKEKGHAGSPQEGNADDQVVSKPTALGSLDIGQGASIAPYWYNRARHHIIPAKQCFAKVRRLTRMAMAAGYDVNDGGNNGIGLPTVKNNYTHNGKTQKYGKFSLPEKRDIAFEIMKITGKQWHVGHHHYTIPVNEGDENGAEEEGTLDHMCYDMEVIKKLIMVMEFFVKANLCDQNEDQSSAIKDEINKVSRKIRDKLNSFASNPSESRPFFVSALAMHYAQKN